ncbi:Uncharacterized protein OBRU01_15690 [Operophtera brumata]|uniref:Aminopeptidase n=1 Tax=Operophtera brumata TaxID=104452 RepID=A0A0L7L425_OPEBR|nr:Uncharacterized protein OBRU01_15690 [Operophtera brumata]
MAHELGHKWFGNLVTCFWWSNLWLNESFASFFEYFGAHNADPSLELADQFVVDYVHSALNWDAAAGATPMNWTSVIDNDSVSAHFSTTSYAKGASVLRMLEHFVGERTFRNALRYYLRDNAYQLGTPEKLYDAFRQATSEDLSYTQTYPGIEIGELFDSWVQNGGSPVVNVDVNMNTGVITLSQERFLISTPATPLAPQQWQIPISWTHSGNLDFTNTKPALVLTDTATIQNAAGHNFVILNIAQSGLYRVNYDDHNWEMIASYLRGSNRQRIHKLNRAQIVNDVLHFLRADKISITRAFDVLSFLEHETDYYVWAGALGQIDWLRRRLEHLPAAHAQFDTYLLSLMDTAIGHLGYNEGASDSTSTILNRMQILNYACNLGHAGCVSDSLNKWRNHRADDSILVPVNLRRYVYCVGIREGDATDYEFLYAKYNASQNTADMVVILRALGCTKDETLLNHYLGQSMHNDRVRIHDKTNAFSYALQGNRENLPIVLSFLYANYNEIRETYGGSARLTIAINALATYLTDFTLISELELGASFGAAINVVNSAISNLAWGNRLAPEIYEYLLERNSAVTVAAPILLLFAALAARFLH